MRACVYMCVCVRLASEPGGTVRHTPESEGGVGGGECGGVGWVEDTNKQMNR